MKKKQIILKKQINLNENDSILASWITIEDMKIH